MSCISTIDTNNPAAEPITAMLRPERFYQKPPI
jgi:hypothetical protein